MWLLYLLIFIAGTILGSFINVLIYRLPIMIHQEIEKTKTNINLLLPRSMCPHCKKTIKIWMNIPIISYLLLRGRCYFCKKKISTQYPLVEIISGLLCVIAAIYFGITWQALFAMMFLLSLFTVIIIDFKTQLIPDLITLPMIWVGLLINLNNMFASITDAIIGAVIGYLFLWVVAQLFKLIRKVDGMGYGDMKLAAMIGAWLGWQMIPQVIVIASLSGAIVGIVLMIFKKYKRMSAIAFGPYLAIAGIIALFFGQTINNWYLTTLF